MGIYREYIQGVYMYIGKGGGWVDKVVGFLDEVLFFFFITLKPRVE